MLQSWCSFSWIIGVIFKKKRATDSEENVETNAEYNNTDDDTSVVYSDNGCDDSDYEDGNEYEDEYIPLYERADIHKTLLKVRKMVVFFKNSPVRNAILQKHVVNKYGKELSLLLDCKTRWNSSETMVERILHLYEPIKSAFVDLDLIEKFFTQNEFLLLQELLATLRPVRMAVEKLSSRDANLLTSEGILQFVFDELKSYVSVGNMNISNEVYEALKVRIGQRRNNEIVSV